MTRAILLGLIATVCHAADISTFLAERVAPMPRMPGYSEYLPPYPAGVRPYQWFIDDSRTLRGSAAFEFHDAKDSNRFAVGFYEEMREIRPGVRYLAEHLLEDLAQLNAGETPGGDKLKGISALLLEDNAYWPADLPKFPKRPVVTLTPVVLSRVMEELGRRHPWTVFGGWAGDWETAFWSSLPQEPKVWLRSLVTRIYGNADGIQILSEHPDDLPTDLRDWAYREPARGLRYLVTFVPYRRWPKALRDAYVAGKFDAIPSPASLVFASSPFYDRLAATHPEAREIPLGEAFSNYTNGLNRRGLYGLRGLNVVRHRNRFQRPSRRAPAADEKDPFLYFFDSSPKALGLYGKPAARNVQAWWVSGPRKGQWLLDGPSADKPAIQKARKEYLADQKHSNLRYRDYTLPMQVNGALVRWVRPMVAWRDPKTGVVDVDLELTGNVHFDAKSSQARFPVVIRDTGLEKEMVEIAGPAHTADSEVAPLNIKKIVEFSKLLRSKVPIDFAEALVNPGEGYHALKKQLPAPARARLASYVDESARSVPLSPVTFAATVNSDFEISYWQRLVDLTEGGALVDKNNCDCAATDHDKKAKDPHCDRSHLVDVVGYLESQYRALGLTPVRQHFAWKLDFDIPWWGGLKVPQQNLIVVIHGKDGHPHDEAVLFGDHYDTAYMADIYEGKVFAEGDRVDSALAGHRHAAPGADDNHSATATLIEAARVLKDLPLKRDVYLVHLTGEEFPADGLGSRALVDALVHDQALVPGRRNPKFVGIYVMDMIGHDTARDHSDYDPKAPAVFQISPGRGEGAARLALAAHRATQSWNRLQKSENWNAKYGRSGAWQRYPMQWHVGPKPFANPKLGEFLTFSGEIRPGWHFRSSLYNTDIQVYSDAGVPAVLFMENYEIDRKGYHDSMDNLANIDLDYARGVASIAIETVAAVARGAE